MYPRLYLFSHTRKSNDSFSTSTGMTGPRGRTGRPGLNGTPGIPGINAWKVKVNGTFSDQYLVPPSIAGMNL